MSKFKEYEYNGMIVFYEIEEGEVGNPDIPNGIDYEREVVISDIKTQTGESWIENLTDETIKDIASQIIME